MKHWLVVAGLLVCGVASGAMAQVDSNIAVTPYAQGRGIAPCVSPGNTGCGGCYPDGLPSGDPLADALAQLPKVNPEWQGIATMIQPPAPGADLSLPPNATPVRITGTIGLSKSPGDDFPGSHVSPDYNAEIIPDDVSRLATGNGNNRVEFEHEGDLFPLYMWAGEGDKVIAEGRWIFDCGHPDPGPLGKCSNNASKSCVIDSDCTSPGTCTSPPPNFAFQSELHPPQATVMIRDKSLPASKTGRTSPAIPAKQADVYISANNGGAGDRCTVTHLASASDVLFSKSCYLNHCSVTVGRSCRSNSDCAANETCLIYDPAGRLANVNASDFAFDLPLPSPPSMTSTLQIKMQSFKPKGGQMPKPVFTLPTQPYGPSPTVHVVVPMSALLANGKMPDVFAERISAGWKEDVTALTHVQVKFKKLHLTNPVKHSAAALNRVCTDPNGGLTATSCTTDTDCMAGNCASSGKSCYSNKDCSKKDFCAGPSNCVGGLTPGWRLWAEVNGDWVKFKKLETVGATAPFTAPPYAVPSPIPTITESFTFNEYVPPMGAIHLKVSGRSLNCLNTLFGGNLKDGLATYGLGGGAGCLNAGSTDPGTIDLTLNGPNFGTTGPGQLTTFTTAATGGDGGTCSMTTTQLCVDSADCPGGETCVSSGGGYQLEYTVKVIP
ncbi:MAG: hypothetical protein HY270_10595 [Deltaproteobacteria bacterium]|nr:hypothetical protein [Deltaproteobacteria bacterium]